MINDITIILVSYKSNSLVKKFVKLIPKELPIIIIDNSKDYDLKSELEKKYPNIKVYLRENNGVGSAINFAVSNISTKYFLQISPDIEFNFKDLQIFIEIAKKLNNEFAAIGPRFLNVNSKSHKQISIKKKFDSIDSIVGSCMFINKSCFEKIGGFDENIFLYFEETEYCYRGKLNNYKSYQTNELNAKISGMSVQLNEKEKNEMSQLLIWHFIWSKFYFYKKKYGKIISIIIFLPTIFRAYLKLNLHKIFKNDKQIVKYKARLDGLFSSIKGKKSYLRP